MFFVNCVLACCTTVLTPEATWSREDQSNLTIARNRCREIYPESHCLTKFTKMEPQVYRAVCGKDNN